MTFTVPADAYDRFMGRYSRQLSRAMADAGDVRAGQRALDVGAGLVRSRTDTVTRLGAGAVAAVDPSERFVAACRTRHPGVDVHMGPAETLPFTDGTFDAALAQLVVQFMSDPVAGLREMARVTRAGGVIAACVWDGVDGMGMLHAFWDAATTLDPDVRDESGAAGVRRGQLGDLMCAAGLDDVRETTLEASVTYASFDEWWQPFLLGVGPAGAHAASLHHRTVSRTRELARSRLPAGSFALPHALGARGTVVATA